MMLQHDIASDKERYGYIAKNEAEHIITTIDCVMSRTNTLKTMVQQHDGDTSWFDNVAEDLYTAVQDETGVSLKNFAVAPDGVVSDVYPLEGNENLIGFDFLDTTLKGNLEAKEAYENGLKQVNDTLGHSAGDELLSGATICMQSGFGPYGNVYRIGGDEFVALINVNEEMLAGILENAQRIMDNWKGRNVDKLSISIGYASHHRYPDLSIDALGKAADKMMYAVKEEYYQHHGGKRR
ncbi:MAG: sensor domain-containing diguanylate cyclase [Lachnospiraceae bacterium]|nr:sensor domain-containing diguanylate cyclase [Lachnospiraceae bacterium]